MSSPSSQSSIYDEQLDDPYLDYLQSPSSSQPDFPGQANFRPPQLSLHDPHPLRFRFVQAFGDRPLDAPSSVFLQENDSISCVAFNPFVDFLAAGDKRGRISIFKRLPSPTSFLSQSAPYSPSHFPGLHHPVQSPHLDVIAPQHPLFYSTPQFRFWTQFQSHEAQFDYLKSMEIDEKINKISWCRPASDACRLIAANDKTVKVWRVSENGANHLWTVEPPHNYAPQTHLHRHNPSSPQLLSSPITPQRQQTSSVVNPSLFQIPRLQHRQNIIRATPRRVFSNAHGYHINSISVNSDEQIFLSADDLRVNLWNMTGSGVGFNILDLKPNNMKTLSEVITCARFHPHHCQLLVHTSSMGAVNVCDLRTSALCHSAMRKFQIEPSRTCRSSFFSDVVTSISDVKFSPAGRWILTRDFMNLRLWDMHMEGSPVRVIPVHKAFHNNFLDMYESECVFDKFQCCFSHDGGSILTGSYNSLFQAYSTRSGIGTAVEASLEYAAGVSKKYSPREGSDGNMIGTGTLDSFDPTKRIMHLDASSRDSLAAVAVGPALYIYKGMPKKEEADEINM